MYRWFRKDVHAVYGTRHRSVPFDWYRVLALRKWAKYSGTDPRTYVNAQAVCEYGSKMGALAYAILSFSKPVA